MEKFHTIIIGAGPGGLSCAEKLASNGYKVLVIERKRTIGAKVCAGGIPASAAQALNIPAHLIERSFPEQFIKTPWQEATLRQSTPIISTINRKKFGQWMLDKAVKAGAHILTGTNVTSVTDYKIKTHDQEFQFKNLVGADGSTSLVRKHLKLPTTKLGAGLHYQVPRHFNRMEWHLDPWNFNSGYAWIFPHKDSTSIGIYAERNDLRPGLLRDHLHEWTKKNNFDLTNCRPEASLINFDFRGWNFGNIFLVGDAAGLASGFTGEGIYPAIVSGETVANSIMDHNFQPVDLNRIIAKQQRHNQAQKFFCGNKVICQISMEMLVLALRSKIIGFKVLELF